MIIMRWKLAMIVIDKFSGEFSWTAIMVVHSGKSDVIWNFDYRHLFSRLTSCEWRRTPVYPVKTSAKPQVIGNFLTSPGQDSNSSSGER